MTDPARYWPGGIPEHIRYHHEPVESHDEEIKGWQLFLEESAERREPGNSFQNFEVDQRRKLIERWVALEQPERDAYHDRAPIRAPVAVRTNWYPPILKDIYERRLGDHGFCNLLVPQPLSRRNQALWAKLRIMMYRFDGTGEGPCIGDLNKHSGIYTIEMNAAGPNPFTPDDFHKWAYVDNADFHYMAMTRQGTVVINNCYDTLFADQEALETGRLLFCHFENNGRVAVQARVYAFLTFEIYCKVEGLGHDLPYMLDDDCYLTSPYTNEESLDMEKPIMEVLKSKQRLINIFPEDMSVSERRWRPLIERYAPGYLDAEADGDGMAPDYNHDDFATGDEL